MRTPRRAALALTMAALLAATGAVAAHADEIELDVEIPAVVDEPFTVSNAQLRWGLNAEAGGGAFAGGCNFLSAGEVGDTGGSKVWTAQDGYFRTTAGAVTIEKPVTTSSGTVYRPVKFADRCLDAGGKPVTTSSLKGTGIQAVIDKGTGRVDPRSGDATISWEGSFTVAFYGGMTYWWVTDPELKVRDGVGTLTATLGGYGTSMDDLDKWTKITPKKVVLARLPEVSLDGDKGFAAQPAYRGVKVRLPGSAVDQVTTGEHWGAFPQAFVDFHAATGQQAYWYSSGGARDAAKPATPLQVSYDADAPQDPDEPDLGDPEDDKGGDQDGKPENRVKPPPAVNPAPPGVNLPPAGGIVAQGAGGLGSGLPGAVPSVTVLPAFDSGASAAPVALATTGSTPPGLVPAGAAVLLGIALTILGYRLEWLVWPGSKGTS